VPCGQELGGLVYVGVSLIFFFRELLLYPLTLIRSYNLYSTNADKINPSL
jgi:hypothetical protein